MQHKKFKFSAVFLLTMGLAGLYAQEVIPAGGGDGSGSGGSISYTVGQVIYTTLSGTSGSLAQGVQQPFEISVETSLEGAKGINLMVSAYPNPVTDYLVLNVDVSALFSIQSMQYQLYDVQGKLLETRNLESRQTTIPMGNLEPATYFLKVIQNNQEIKTFKIIKTM